MKTTMSLAAAVGSLVLAAGTANAATVLVGNHSFEDDGTGSGGGVSKAPWMKSGGTSNNISIQEYSGLPGGSIDPVPDGSATSHYTNGPSDNIYQVLVATLAANTTYTLKVDVGDRELTAQAGSINLGYVSAAPTGDNDYGLNLLSATVVNDTVPVNGAGATDGWETWESTFTTGAAPVGLGQALRIELVTDAGVQTLWDNVRLDAVTVPEPSSTALLGLGGLALILRRRK